MGQIELSEKIRQELASVADYTGCELLDARFAGGVLRLIIDRPDGVNLEDCQTVSKLASALLDVEDFGSSRYVLEVSSPGLDRQFYGEGDYERFSGRKVRVTWKEPEMEHKQTVIGILKTYQPDRRQITLEASEGDNVYTITLQNILMARLEPEL